MHQFHACLEIDTRQGRYEAAAQSEGLERFQAESDSGNWLLPPAKK